MSKSPRTGALASAAMFAGLAGLSPDILIKPRKIKEYRMPLTDAELEKLRSFDTRAEDRKIRSQQKRERKAYVRELESKYAEHLRARVLGLPLPVYATDGRDQGQLAGGSAESSKSSDTGEVGTESVGA